MKIEILADRLAKKTNTPLLADFILGTKPFSALPLDCMIWTGCKTTGGFRLTLDRDSNNIPVHHHVLHRSMGQIQVDGKREYVHRLVYKILTKPSYEFRMENRCGNPLCVNPKHWEVYSEAIAPPVVFEVSEWTPEEIEEAVDAMLGRYVVHSWEDVITNPLTMDIPHHLLRDHLETINKEHLTC